jgi:hypothetical protein
MITHSNRPGETPHCESRGGAPPSTTSCVQQVSRRKKPPRTPPVPKAYTFCTHPACQKYTLSTQLDRSFSIRCFPPCSPAASRRISKVAVNGLLTRAPKTLQRFGWDDVDIAGRYVNRYINLINPAAAVGNAVAEALVNNIPKVINAPTAAAKAEAVFDTGLFGTGSKEIMNGFRQSVYRYPVVCVRREKALVLSGRGIPPGHWFAPPSSNRSSSGGNEAAETSGVEGRFGDLGSL